MTSSSGEQFAEGRYRTRELAVDLPGHLELLSRSHRTFCARAAQELHRAERYREYLSLVIVHGDQSGISDPGDPYQDMRGPLANVCAAVRADCRISDVVSGVESGRFAVLLVETGIEGAQQFCHRLEQTIRSMLSGHPHRTDGPIIPIEVITFPDRLPSQTTLAQALNALYQRSNTRPHIA